MTIHLATYEQSSLKWESYRRFLDKKQSEAITPAMIAAEIEKLKDLTFTEEN